VYASDAFSCPVSLLLSFIPGIRILYHEHDSPAPAPSRGFLGVVMRCRLRLARRAKLCILPNPNRAQRFLSEAGGTANVITVLNCPRREEISEPRPAARENGIWLHYHGSISGELLPISVLYALAELPEFVKLRVIGYETIGSQGYSERIKEVGRELGVLHRIEFPGAMPRYELLQRCRQSDIGLALMPRDSNDSNMQAMAGASNKAFDYLACGLALVVSDLPDWRGMFVDPGYGVACRPEDQASITEALRNLIGDPDKMRAMGECGRQRIEREWNYERQFEPVLAAIEA
jgi:glycosyltransferase involved in cell wall biosynthesis